MSTAAKLVTSSLGIVAQFLEDKQLIDLAAASREIGKAVKFEVGFRREVWVDSRPQHGNRS
jgi:hypothetical protein